MQGSGKRYFSVPLFYLALVFQTACFCLYCPGISFSQQFAQPTSMSFSSSQGYAGNDCYVLTIDNAYEMTVDLQYTLDGIPQTVGSVTTNSSEQSNYCLKYDDRLGTYTFTAIKNRLRTDWVVLDPPVSYTILPQQPKSLTITPSVITAGQGSYRMVVGNGANVTLDLQYTLNNEPKIEPGWPSLAPVSPSSPDGYIDFPVGPCTPPGNYLITAIKNTVNTSWVTLTPPVSVTINPPASPTITSLVPSSGTRGSSVFVTLSGANLCNVSLSTTWPGLTFSNVSSSDDGRSVSATFNIAASASFGSAPITLSAVGGSTTSNLFTVVAPPPPAVTSATPTTGARGSNVAVTITGSNLYNVSLSTTHAGLSFSNIAFDSTGGTWASATFNIAATTAAGTPGITVSAAGGTAIFLFTITAPGPVLRKEYIYTGRRLVTTEAP